MISRPAPRLILLCGLPGAGKTTLATRLQSAAGAVRFCPDEWMADLGVDLNDEEFRDRLECRFWRLAQDLLRAGQIVILEFGLWVREHRDEKRLAARALGVPVELHYIDVPVDELWRRLQARNDVRAYGTVTIARELLDEYVAIFQPPSREELALFDAPQRSER